MDYKDQTFSQDEVKRIVGLAVRKNSAKPESYSGNIGYSTLSEIVKEVGISQEDLDSAIDESRKEISTKRKKISNLKYLAIRSLMGIGAIAGVATLINMAYKSEKENSELVNAVVTQISNNSGYGISFRVNNTEYIAKITQRDLSGPEEFAALKEGIRVGSQIGVERGALKRFNGLTGLVVDDEIMVLKR